MGAPPPLTHFLAPAWVGAVCAAGKGRGFDLATADGPFSLPPPAAAGAGDPSHRHTHTHAGGRHPFPPLFGPISPPPHPHPHTPSQPDRPEPCLKKNYHNSTIRKRKQSFVCDHVMCCIYVCHVGSQRTSACQSF